MGPNDRHMPFGNGNLMFDVAVRTSAPQPFSGGPDTRQEGANCKTKNMLDPQVRLLATMLVCLSEPRRSNG